MKTSVPLLHLVLLLAACGAPEAPPPIRLLGAGEHLSSHGPSPALESAGSGAPVFSDLPRNRVGRVAMDQQERGWDSRAALLAADGTRHRFLIELPENPALRVGLGYRPPDDDAPAQGTVRYRVAVTEADANGGPVGPTATPVDETRAVETSAGWRDLEVPLEGFAGRRVILELRTDASAGVAAAWSAPEVVSPGGRERGWDVLLVSLDTLRADHLGSYGYHRSTSPRLDALAADGVRFATAVAQAPWTRPSHRSMLDGLYPASHGDLESPMLPLLLWRAGYRTTALTGGGQIDPRFGFDRGIESYRIADWVEGVDRVVETLEERPGRKQFLFLHTYRIHDPYRGDAFTEGLEPGRIGDSFGKHDWARLDKELTDEEKAYVEALYDGGIAVTDEVLGRLFDAMERNGLLDRTIVIVTSDHGEQFWEHGTWRHGQVLYDHQIVVPLIVRLPPALARELDVDPGTVIEEQVELVDLYPTLLELLGLPLEHEVQGRSLVPLLRGGSLPPDDALAENTNVATYERKALRTERFKFVKSIPRRSARARGVTEPIYELFDLRRDPREYDNIAGDHPEMIEALDQRLRQLHAGLEGLDEELPDDLDPDLRKRLQALGYLGDP